MTRKLIDISDAERGGESTLLRHGAKHFSKIAKERHAELKKTGKGEDFYKQLAAAGNHARQVKIQTKIAASIGEKLHPSAFDHFTSFLSGKK